MRRTSTSGAESGLESQYLPGWRSYNRDKPYKPNAATHFNKRLGRSRQVHYRPKLAGALLTQDGNKLKC
jgi:hypothetical protein